MEAIIVKIEDSHSHVHLSLATGARDSAEGYPHTSSNASTVSTRRGRVSKWGQGYLAI